MSMPPSAEEDYYESLDAQAEAEQGMAEAEMEAEAHEAEEAADQLAQAEIDAQQLTDDLENLENQPGKNPEPAGVVDEVRTIIIQGHPYEISTTVANKTNAKGDFQPEAKIKITRHLETGDEIDLLIRADISRGVEETMQAINKIHARKR